MQLFKKIKNLEYSDIPDIEGWIGDAKFGLSQLVSYFEKKKKISGIRNRLWYRYIVSCIKRSVS